MTEGKKKEKVCVNGKLHIIIDLKKELRKSIGHLYVK